MARGANPIRLPDLDISSRVPAGQLGHVQIGTDTYPLLYAGPWSATDPVSGGSIIYHKGQVVSDGGTDYVCLATNTNDEPPSGNWDTFDAAQYVLNAQRIWTKIPSGGIIGNLPSLEEAYFTPSGLTAWWRLGETTPWPTDGSDSPNWALDSSGNGHHMTARNRAEWSGMGPFVPEVPPGSVLLPSLGVVGALPAGADDGAIHFNLDSYHWISDFDGINALAAPITWGESAGLAGSAIGAGRTLSVFINFQQQTSDDNVPTALFGGGGTDLPFLSTFEHSFGIGSFGWQLVLQSETGVLRYTVAEGDGSTPGAGFTYSTTAGLIPGRWYHFAVVISKIGTSLYRRRILLNLTEVFNGTFTQPCTFGTGVSLGGGNVDDIRFGMSRGGADELSLWEAPLTDAQLATIFNVANTSSDTWTTVTIGSGGSGSIGAVGSGAAPVGTFMKSDGSGGTDFEKPPLAVYHNGA